MKCFPLKSIKELADFDCFKLQSLYQNVQKRAKRVAVAPEEPKLLVCHDFCGGYHEDAETEGTFYSESSDKKYPLYTFMHWHVTDIFIYFSHERVTIPPVSWINSAHRNGVKILGTFITEWGPGVSENGELLKQDVDGKFIYAHKLVEIAAICGFDGWFFNFESVFPSDSDIRRLIEFLRYITKLSHAKIPESLILMYDSITSDNKIAWQDCLNERNHVFFDACDGLFTNYTWNIDKLQTSAKYGNLKSRLTDIYTGNDVWGRNTYGGGEFKTFRGLEAINTHGTSIALFAQAWTFEKFGAKNFLENDDRLWYSTTEGLCWHLRERALESTSFYTNFDRGFGKIIAYNGKIIFDGLWHNISLQSVLPNMQYSKLFKSLKTGQYDNHCRLCWDLTDELAWNGGACIKITSSKSESDLNAIWTSHLFNSNIQIRKSRISISHLQTRNVTMLLKISSEDIEKFSELYSIVKDHAASRYLKLKLDFHDEWRTTQLIVYHECHIQEILLCIETDGDGQGYIGEISIEPL